MNNSLNKLEKRLSLLKIHSFLHLFNEHPSLFQILSKYPEEFEPDIFRSIYIHAFYLEFQNSTVSNENTISFFKNLTLPEEYSEYMKTLTQNYLQAQIFYVTAKQDSSFAYNSLRPMHKTKTFEYIGDNSILCDKLKLIQYAKQVLKNYILYGRLGYDISQNNNSSLNLNQKLTLESILYSKTY